MLKRFGCRKIIILVLSSLFLLTPQAFAQLEIIFPITDKVKSVSDIHIIGRSSVNDPVTIEINGEKNVKKLIESKGADGKKFYMLMTILKLNEGDNTILVTQGKTVMTVQVNKVDSPTTITDWTESYQNFHSSDRKEICLNCHRFQNLNDCVNCHRDKFMGTWVHAPVKQAKCFVCHEKDNNLIPQEPFSVTCLKCHENFNNQMQKAQYIHGPVAAGFCTICHSPHKSTDKTHLRKPVNELCDSCHASNELGFNYHQKSYIKFHPVDKVFVEKLNKTLDCADCHTPHYSSDPLLLSTDKISREELCAKCHEEQSTAELLKVLTDKHNAAGN